MRSGPAQLPIDRRSVFISRSALFMVVDLESDSISDMMGRKLGLRSVDEDEDDFVVYIDIVGVGVL